MLISPRPRKKKENTKLLLLHQELNVPEKDVEQLLVSLILDNRIDGHIDQVNRLLERGDRYVLSSPVSSNDAEKVREHNVKLVTHPTPCRSKGMKKYTAIDKWNTQLKSLYQTVSNRVY